MLFKLTNNYKDFDIIVIVISIIVIITSIANILTMLSVKNFIVGMCKSHSKPKEEHSGDVSASEKEYNFDLKLDLI